MSNDGNSNGRKLSSTVERLLTAQEVADILNVSPSCVVRYARKRLIPSVNIGPHLKRFRPEAIQRFLERHTTDEAIQPVK